MFPQINIIAALASDRALGLRHGLPWHLPDDFKHFKKTTLGHILVMGSKTAATLPKPLPNRKTWVMSRSPKDFAHPDMSSVSSVDEVLAKAQGAPLYICGGAKIYEMFFPLASELILTHVHAEGLEADTYFPDWVNSEISGPTPWTETSRVHHPKDDRHTYDFDIVTYQRALPKP